MGAATAVGMGIQAFGGLAKTIDGVLQARNARKALRDYRRQDLRNPYEGLQVSRLGADLRNMEAQRMMATSMDALRNAGVRGMLGGIGRLQQGYNLLNAEIAANLDEQQQQINQMIANDAVRIRQMQEERETQDIQGLGQQLEVGRQNMFHGVGDMGNALFYMGLYNKFFGKK